MSLLSEVKTEVNEDISIKIEELLENDNSLIQIQNNEGNTTEYKEMGHDIITDEMLKEENKLEQKAILEEEKIKEEMQNRKIEEEKCLKRLHLLLNRSSIYAKFLAEKLEQHEIKQKKKEERQNLKSSENKDSKAQSSKRKAITSPLSSAKKQKTEVKMIDLLKKEDLKNLPDEKFEKDNLPKDSTNSNENSTIDSHPSLLYGGVMRSYQLEGYEWLKSLYENGVNGILADEMGLGKTIQCIAFVAYLIEMGIPGPFLVCAPLSTLPNWYSEFKRFTPDIPVILYHGTDRHSLLPKITKKVKNDKVSCCPVIITSYQIALIDVARFSKIGWKMLVIDEAHRIKNFECKLIKALKKYKAAHRLLLTGTPLQNNLDELWSLLNFILPEIFDDLKVFQSWFDIHTISRNGARAIIAKEQEKQIISTIHQILTPFLLRRTKADVALDLPSKKEVIVHAPLTALQKNYYSAVINKTIAKLLQAANIFDTEEPLAKRRPLKPQFFGCENEDIMSSAIKEPNDSDGDVLSKLNLKLQNTQMILRKICGHPYLISYPLKPIDEDIVNKSGKILVLDLMLPELKKRGHKVIIFSQFVSMLEILEDYCNFRKYKYTCLYGSMSLNDRQDQLEEFKDDSTFIFLISTRAGGLGINLVSADTVIIYDSDWNPQCDLQAQDRCHRIGQSKPVVVYRFIIPNTIDEKIMDLSTAKRKLEKVIIRKGRFKSRNISQSYKALTEEELLELLESEKFGCVKTDENVLSQEELEKLLDRSDMI